MSRSRSLGWFRSSTCGCAETGPSAPSSELSRQCEGLANAKQTGGDGELGGGLRTFRTFAQLDRLVGRWRSDGRFGWDLRVVVLRRPPGRRDAVGYFFH